MKASYKISEHESIRAIQNYLPCRLSVIYIYSHQDKIRGRDNFTLPEKLIDLVDSVADKYDRSPINNHVPFTHLAIWFDKSYILNNYLYHLLRLWFQKDVNEYIKKKYNWRAYTSADIDWESHVKTINKKSHYSYQVKIKYIHHLLSSGKNYYLIKHQCLFCKSKKTLQFPMIIL